MGVDLGCLQRSTVAAHEGPAPQGIAGCGLGEDKGIWIAPARRPLPPTKLLPKMPQSPMHEAFQRWAILVRFGGHACVYGPSPAAFP